MLIKGPRSDPADKREVERHIVAGFISVILYFGVMYFCVPFPMPSLPSMLDKLVFTLRLQTFSGLTLITGIYIVMTIRLHTTAIDPTSGKGEHLLTVPLRYNSNTLEQFIISFVGQLVLTTYLSEPQMRAIPILVSMFVVGRFVFYVGYTISPTKRAVGFCITLAPTLAVWLVNVFHLVSGLF